MILKIFCGFEDFLYAFAIFAFKISKIFQFFHPAFLGGILTDVGHKAGIWPF